ncbi:MAG: hypothetical protein JNM21_01330 [Taibaiella sp.]|nr:hypothetical protein [Taibaiella sp.]
MIQISENRFKLAIKSLQSESAYDNFINKVQQKLNDYRSNKVVIYSNDEKKILTSSEKADINRIKEYKIKNSTFCYQYLEIIKDIKNLVCLNPFKLNGLINKINAISISCKEIVKKQFLNDIEELLDYKNFRKKVIPLFYNLLGIKVCVYCNAQHTIFLRGAGLGRYQADHNVAKSTYPFLAITLSNLYPTCNNCNHLKSKSPLDFKLYYKIKSKQINYIAYLEEKDIVAFVSGNFDESKLSIKFRDVPDDFKNTIRPLEIYENHTDYAADLIKKKIIYNKTYKDSLTKDFQELFPSNTKGAHNKQLFDRLIYGSSLEEDDIHKRVFSKLNIDIMNQLDQLSPDKLKY